MIGNKNYNFPAVSAYTLQVLELYEVPFDFDWQRFVYHTTARVFVFPRAEKMKLEFNEMPDNPRLVLPLYHNPIVLGRTEEPLPIKVQHHPRGGDDEPAKLNGSNSSRERYQASTMYELNKQFGVYSIEYRMSNFPLLSFPELKHLIIKDCPRVCLMMFPVMEFPLLQRLEYSGAFSGLRLLSAFDPPQLESAKYKITHLDLAEKDEFYKLTNRLFGSKYPSRHNTLCLENIRHQLDIEQIKWENLQVLTIHVPVELVKMIQLLARLPKIKELFVYRLYTSKIYDRQYMLDNINELRQMRNDIKYLHLNRLIMYFADETKNLQMGMIIFLLDSLPRLLDFGINRRFKDKVREYVFNHSYFDCSKLRINLYKVR